MQKRTVADQLSEQSYNDIDINTNNIPDFTPMRPAGISLENNHFTTASYTKGSDFLDCSSQMKLYSLL